MRYGEREACKRTDFGPLNADGFANGNGSRRHMGAISWSRVGRQFPSKPHGGAHTAVSAVPGGGPNAAHAPWRAVLVPDGRMA
jgi:hypothetical protein